MCERSVDEIGEELFDDGVTAVGHIGVHAGQVGVGQERVVASHREQFVLAGWCRVEFADPADHQPCGDLVDGGFEGGVAGFSDLGVRDPLPGQLVEHRTRGSAPVSTRARRWRRWPLQLRVGLQGQRKVHPARRHALTTGPEPNAESPRTRIAPVAPLRRAVAIACITSEAAARAEPALLPRNRLAATTGAAWSVLTAAISGDRPRSRRL